MPHPITPNDQFLLVKIWTDNPYHRLFVEIPKINQIEEIAIEINGIWSPRGDRSYRTTRESLWKNFTCPIDVILMSYQWVQKLCPQALERKITLPHEVR